MPLICENVAAWWLKRDPNSNGNVPDRNFIFYFDPDQTNKTKRRQRACGCFAHDDCGLSGTSNGKSRGVAVTVIATDTVSTAITAYDPVVTQVLLAGMSFDR